MKNLIINYSQCWEDTEALLKALKVNSNDVIISVTSGADNTIALSLCKPKKIIAIDINPVQNYLLELKLKGIKKLTYPDYLVLIGLKKAQTRLEIYRLIRNELSLSSKNWWDQNKKIIEKGIIHQGRFEKFLNFFRQFLLPTVHSQKTISQFISFNSTTNQSKYYKVHWNNRRWKLYFRLATSRFVLKNFARQKGMFTYTQFIKISDQYSRRLEKNILNIPLNSNFYLHYCLTGHFPITLPNYLLEKNFKLLKSNSTEIETISQSIITFLKSSPDNSFSKYNLSDIFEALSKNQILQLWTEIIRTARPNARIIYWDNLIPNLIPPQFSDIVKSDQKLEQELFKKDRVFFYGSLHIYRIKK